MGKTATEDACCDTGLEAVQEETDSSLQRPSPYLARVLEKVGTRPGCWEYLRVGIFWKNPHTGIPEQIGEYTRNYPSFYRTFHPFQLRGKWYALYSKDYTSTQLMALPGCKDIGGEEAAACGFCPVDYYVPVLNWLEAVHAKGCPRHPEEADFSKPCTCICKDYKYIWHFPERVHGFVAGCVWGDDTSWKVQYLDLSRADEGVLRREERFGYIELAYNLHLDEAVDLSIEDDRFPPCLSIACQRHFDFATGRPGDEE